MFKDRAAAGRDLGLRLVGLRGARPVVLALPRGGVPVAAEVAAALDAPLGLVLVRKIGAPGQPELAAGAIVDGPEPVVVRNPSVIERLGIGEAWLARAAAAELQEIERRRALYGPEDPAADPAGATAILVDDGIATGATMRAALRAVRMRAPARLVLAVPVIAAGALAALEAEADEVVALDVPRAPFSVGQSYADFHQLDDEELLGILRAARRRSAGRTADRPPQPD